MQSASPAASRRASSAIRKYERAAATCRALKEVGRDQQVVFVGHGLTPDTRSLLIDGTMDAVITQYPQTIVMNCVRIFANLRDRRSALAGVEPVRISIVLRENLP